MAEGGSGDMDDAGDCSGARYNDWSDDDNDDDDSNESRTIVWYPPWARIGTEAGTRARARARARANRARQAVQKRASPNSNDTVLSPQELQKVLCLVEMSEKPYILEAALIALGNNAAYAFNRDIIRDLGGLPVVAKILNTRDPIVKEKALIVLNNLSVNTENQRRLQIYMSQVCDDTVTSRLNSSVQLAGLRLLTNMTVTNEYQHILANSISDFFRLFSAGNEETKLQVLKLLLNLAENPAMPRELLRAQVPASLGSLFDKKENQEVILKLLIIFEHINNNFKWEENEPTQNQFGEGSLFFFLKEFQVCADKVLGIESHHDFLVKAEVEKFMAKLAEHMFPKNQE
ncbi:PREDICTED: armadillo repeat-containing X-linked protein 3-like [Dipodomys ordii]|uniref:Armadillo repeat-containing X-linked protein 3-like n=1 Tax=Dipodomys ordii TaxID=10020 RepID=A0A1S3FPI2_DIPOR|nr:PREDICTED: armadillo repeat-containing X-linked protein 3-like [Dipodomys ordii]